MNYLDSFFLIFNSLSKIQLIFIFISFLIIFLIGLLIGKLSLRSALKKERADAIKRSRSVLGGQMAEQIAPFLPGFPCNPADARFIGKPIDFIAFPGAVTNDEIKEVLLIEVKSGNAVLSEREKEIKRAVQKGHVRYVEYRVP